MLVKIAECIYRIANNYFQKVLKQDILKPTYLTKCIIIRVNYIEEKPEEQELLTGFHII